RGVQRRHRAGAGHAGSRRAAGGAVGADGRGAAARGPGAGRRRRRSPRRRRQAAPRDRLGPGADAGPDAARHAGLLETATRLAAAPGAALDRTETPPVKIAVIGTGYVGLVTATCLAESGNDVIGIDKDAAKIARLDDGELPIYEPGLLELVQRNAREGRLHFTTDLGAAVSPAQIVFLAVGTPQGKDGSADLSNVWAVGDALAQAMNGSKIIIIKSTVPVGTNRQLAERLAARTKHPFEVASNPEFLKEGAAVDDFMKPDRVVVGVRRPEVAEVLRELYAPFLRTEHPFLVMSPESAEMTKYVANAMLATKI